MIMENAILHLLKQHPFYARIVLMMTLKATEDVETIHLVHTSTMKLEYNPQWFKTFSRDQQVGIIIHELLHGVFLHHFRRDHRERKMWTVSCDLAVNSHIQDYMLLPDAVTVEKLGVELKINIPKGKSAEYYYKLLTELNENLDGKEEENHLTICLKNNSQLSANAIPDNESLEIDRGAFEQQMAKMLEESVALGDLPGSLKNTIDQVYEAYQLSWRRVLKHFLTGRGRIETRKTYKRQSRRHPNLPGTKRLVGVKALLAVDESGSITNGMVKRFYSELQHLNQVIGADISVTRFDVTCTNPISIQTFRRDTERIKSGGTDFRPIFKMADQMRISFVIILTDGDGIVPEAVNQRVLWVLVKGGKNPSTYGRSVIFE